MTTDGHDARNAAEVVAEPGSGGAYALALSEDEVRRDQVMAEHAVTAERELWALAGITLGATAADIGCGPGAEAAVLAEAVGPGGRVYAVDADPQAVRLAAELARRAGLSQVSTDVADAAATGLPAGSVDVAMIRNVLAHNGGRSRRSSITSPDWSDQAAASTWLTQMGSRSGLGQPIRIWRICRAATAVCTPPGGTTSRSGCGSPSCWRLQAWR